MANRGVIQLQADERMADKVFTSLEHLEPEWTILSHMASILCQTLESLFPFPAKPRPLIVFHTEANKVQQRMVINRPERLMQIQHLVVVGFFGQKRKDAEYVPLRNKYDHDMLAEFPKNPDLLSYSTLELPGDGFGNLVLFARSGAKKHWNESPIHAQAVAEFAPIYYDSIRIYNGYMPGGLVASDQLKLEVIKYYDFNEEPVWRALREL